VTARFAALLGVLIVLAGCGVPGSAAPQSAIEGSTLHTINLGGLARSYRLYIPVGLASPAPLVVMMHGGFGSAQQAERAYGWNELADSAKFVVAYPDGVGRAWNVNGVCCGMLAYALACNAGTFAAIGPDSATQLDACKAPQRRRM
jgi:polyhydroxybutyrate depolymerase